MKTDHNKELYKRFEPDSLVENNQSKKASINNENYNIQSQGTNDKR